MARIHLSKATVTEREEQLVVEALRSGWVAPLGPMVDSFEAEIPAFSLDSPHVRRSVH